MYLELSADLGYVEQMSKSSITFGVQLRESYRELQVAGGVVLKAQFLALCRSGEARTCRQYLEGVKEELDLALEMTISVEAVSSKAAIRSEGELAIL